jgi:hypothetical protein
MYSSTVSLTSALDGSGWSTPRPRRFTPRERPGTHFTGGWVGPRAGVRKISFPNVIRSPDRPARSVEYPVDPIKINR